MPRKHLFCRCSVLAALVFVLTVAVGVQVPATEISDRDILRIGVIASGNLEKTAERWTPTVDYLARNLPGHDVEMIPIPVSELQGAVQRQEVDFVIVNPGVFVVFENRYGIVALVTMTTKIGGRAVSELGGVIFTRSDRTDIVGLADLKGKSLMAVARDSFGGYQVALRELQARGINADSDLSRVLFSGFPPENVVIAVLDRQADVGTVRTGILEAMAADGKINLRDFRILNRQFGDSPQALSTQSYPEWAFAKLPHVPAELAKTVTLLLYSLRSDGPAAQAGRYFGWTTPSSYSGVHGLFRELGIGIHEKSLDLITGLQKYWTWLVFAAVILTAVVLRNYAADLLQTVIVRKLNDRGRLAVLALILAGVATTVAAIAFVGLYNAAFEQQKISLAVLAKSQKNLIESVARFDAVYSTDFQEKGAVAATLSQVDGAFRNFINAQGNEDMLLGRRDGDYILYLTRTRIQDWPLPNPVAFSESGDIAMFRALAGQSGVVRMVDGQGVEFLAAYEPIPSLKAGLVARLGIQDIQRPFVIAGLVTGAGALVVILLGVLLFRQISSPLINRLEGAVDSLANAQRLAHIGNWDWDIVSGDLYWSNEIYRIFGHQPGSVKPTYDAFLEAIHPSDRKAVNEAVNATLDTLVPYQIDHRVVHPDGSVHWVRERGEVVEDENGDLVMMSGTVQDITDQKQAEMDVRELNEGLEHRVQVRTRELQSEIAERRQTQELLRESEARTRAIVNSAADGIITITEKGIITSFNAAAEKIFDYSVIEVMGKNVNILMPEEHAGDHDRYIGNFIETGDAKIIGLGREVEGRRKDGSVFSMELAVSTTDIAGGMVFTGIIRDITDRKAIEGALEEKEKLLRDAINNMPGAIVFTDNDANVIVCNVRFEEMCAVPAELLQVGRPYSGVFRFRAERGDYGDGNVEELVGQRMQSLLNPGARTFEDELPDGRIHEVRRREAGGGGVVTVITDITERKEAEDKLHRTLDNLKQTQNELVQSEKMALLGGLVAGVAHEINTPVGIGVTASSHLSETVAALREAFAGGTLKKSELEAAFETIGKSSDMISVNLRRAADLIGSFKQVAVDQSSEEKRLFRVAEYLDEVILSLHPKIKKTKHRIIIDCDPGLQINSYPGALSQIITNLVMNSMIHAYDDGVDGEIRIAVSQDGDRVTLKYSDDGKGMEAESLEKIFDPFFTTRRGSGGSGLGMHILYNLVTQSLGGTVVCDSAPGQGVTFVISFPSKMEEQRATA